MGMTHKTKVGGHHGNISLGILQGGYIFPLRSNAAVGDFPLVTNDVFLKAFEELEIFWGNLLGMTTDDFGNYRIFLKGDFGAGVQIFKEQGFMVAHNGDFWVYFTNVLDNFIWMRVIAHCISQKDHLFPAFAVGMKHDCIQGKMIGVNIAKDEVTHEGYNTMSCDAISKLWRILSGSNPLSLQKSLTPIPLQKKAIFAMVSSTF
jgi:hypothetical protein